MKPVPQVKTGPGLCCSLCGGNSFQAQHTAKSPTKVKAHSMEDLGETEIKAIKPEQPKIHLEIESDVCPPTLLISTDSLESEEITSLSGNDRVRRTSVPEDVMPVATTSMLTFMSQDSKEQSSATPSDRPTATTVRFGPRSNKELVVLREKPDVSLAKKRAAERLNTQLNIRDDREGLNLGLGTPAKPRNKVFLNPGRSLMDWIRLGTSGKDLTGVGGQLLDVTEEELAKHNTKEDAWMCLKGKVYNVTHYLEYHPGGVDILMKGVGKDATNLFMEIHKWVNFESMLQKCLVGRLVTFHVPIANIEVDGKLSHQKRSQPPLFLKPRVSLTVETQPIIRHDWYQVDHSICVVVYTNWSEVQQENIIVDIVNCEELLISCYVKDHMFQIHLELDNKVITGSNVKITANGKVEVAIKKQVSSQWLMLGTPLRHHNKFMPVKTKELHYRLCTLVSKQTVNYNTHLYNFELPEGSRMIVPVGKHVSLKLNVSGVSVSHSYTPVPKKLPSHSIDSVKNFGRHLHFLIKVYSDGALTPELSSAKIGNTVEISDYFGAFNKTQLHKITHLVLLAAGTGLTPMVSIANHFLTVKNKVVLAKLIFFNRQAKDIFWRDQLDNLAHQDERFVVTYVLSDPNSSWAGPVGRVRLDLLQELLPTMDEGQKLYACVCGPTPFNNACEKLLPEVGIPSSQFHIFAND